MDWMSWEFFAWGFFGNTWAWFHMAGGGVGAFACKRYLKNKTSVIVLFTITMIWELAEVIVDGGKSGMIEIYGSMGRWFYDSLGDIVGAMFIALLVIYSYRKEDQR